MFFVVNEAHKAHANPANHNKHLTSFCFKRNRKLFNRKKLRFQRLFFAGFKNNGECYKNR